MGNLEKKGKRYECSECHAYNKESSIKCWKCGTDFTEIIEIHDDIEQKLNKYKNTFTYPALIKISSIFRVFAWIIGLSSVILLIWGVSIVNDYDSGEFGIYLILIGIVNGTIGVLLALAISESIKLFINIANDVHSLCNKTD